MSQYQQRAKKRFGQHFLHDRSVVTRMLSALALKPDDRVIEIGPGPGALTFPLLEQLARLDIVEIDRDVIAWWQQQSAAQGKLHIHAQDALKLDVPVLRASEEQQLRVVGNLPYNISTPLIFHLLSHAPHIRDMLFMLQKEVVDRITATPGSKDFGRLSVMVQYFCETEYLMKVGPGAFNPPPKVDSAVVYLKPRTTFPVSANSTDILSATVAKAFSQRRKTLRNTLKNLITAEQMEAIGIDPSQRAETLAVSDFVRLSNLLTDPGTN
ncbi:MAG: 16S rRNA (adenine(1518)-N(6)/adenine(1519)-N(6))-dimethyltransferase RsmA [Thiolinea sp.]